MIKKQHQATQEWYKLSLYDPHLHLGQGARHCWWDHNSCSGKAQRDNIAQRNACYIPVCPTDLYKLIGILVDGSLNTASLVYLG